METEICINCNEPGVAWYCSQTCTCKSHREHFHLCPECQLRWGSFQYAVKQGFYTDAC